MYTFFGGTQPYIATLTIEIIHCTGQIDLQAYRALWEGDRDPRVGTRAHQDHDARAEEADDAVLDGVEGAVVSGTHARAPDALYLSKRARGGRDDDRDRSIHVPLTGRLVEPAGEARSTRVVTGLTPRRRAQF